MYCLQQQTHIPTITSENLKHGFSLREVFSQEYPVDHGSKTDQVYVRSNCHKAAENLATKRHALLALLRHCPDLPYPNVSDLLLCRTKVPEHATNCLHHVDSRQEEGISIERDFCYRWHMFGTMSPLLKTNNFTILTYKEGSTSCRNPKNIFQILRGKPV